MVDSVFNNAAQNNMGFSDSFNSMMGYGNNNYGTDNYGVTGELPGAEAQMSLYGMPDISSPVGSSGYGFGSSAGYGGSAAAPGGFMGIFGGGDSGIFGSKGLMAGGMEALGLGDMSGGQLLGGLGSLAGFGTSIASLAQNKKRLGIAEDMYQGQIDMYNEQNRMNSQQYNTQLKDRQASRSSAFTPEEMNRYYGDNYIAENTMTPNSIG